MPPITAKTPWAGHTGSIPLHLNYPDNTMFEAVAQIAAAHPHAVAMEFMGRRISYRTLLSDIRACAQGLAALGVTAGDRVTVALPNCPQAVALFYAINLVGGIACMIHPLSAEKEMEFYLNEAGSHTLVTLDAFYPKVSAIRQNVQLKNLLITSVKDALSPAMKLGFALTEGRKIAPVPPDADCVRWSAFLQNGVAANTPSVCRKADDPAVMLYSGGTTGKTKGIVLTNRNFNALAVQIVATNPMFAVGDKMLAAMPVFHGFGLGVCIHSMLANGGRCILVPRFTPASYAKLIQTTHPHFIAGVPTLFEAMLRTPALDRADLSCLKGVFSGGDSLSVELKKKLDAFLASHHASVQVREGYGTTETVTACCLTPPHRAKEGSIGVPFPDTYIKIVRPGTDEELPYGEEGEILLAGPTVMKEYWKDPTETAQVLRPHKDGLTWVYTGDLGTMDDEGFVFFKGRAKRLIVTSGYNVYPNQIENVLDAHPVVQMSCVIGVPDDYRMHRVKAYVMLRPGVPANEQTKEDILAHCALHVAKYAMPREMEFRTELPKTLVGKVAYRELEAENAES